MNVDKITGALQDLVRALRADLVEKRLWPIAIVLAVAAIAVPVGVKLTSSGTTPATPATTAAPTPGVGVAAVAPRVATSHKSGHLGPLRDPFAGGPASSTASATAAPSAPANGTAVRVTPGAPSTTTPVTGGTTGATGPISPTPKPVQPQPVSTTPAPHQPTADPSSLRLYHVSLHFGQGTNTSAHDGVLRLAAFPSTTTPVAQFLGVTASGKAAAFLLWNPVSASGDGVCRRGTSACDIVELKPGGSEFIDVTEPGSGLVQFELDLDSIKITYAKGQLEALNQHARQSQTGVALIIKSTAAALSQLKYSTVLGTLVPAHPAANAAVHPHDFVSGIGLFKERQKHHP